jgi:hypothetical protein
MAIKYDTRFKMEPQKNSLQLDDSSCVLVVHTPRHWENS